MMEIKLTAQEVKDIIVEHVTKYANGKTITDVRTNEYEFLPSVVVVLQ